MSPFIYIALAVGTVALGGGLIGLAVVALWLIVAVVAWRDTHPRVLD